MNRNTIAIALSTAVIVMSQQAMADQVIADDLIVDGSECVGSDCASGESFGFDTVRLKENNVRLNFEDTSSSTGSFPTNDWTLVANDSSNGGSSYLAIQDDDAGNMPFKVMAGAGNNAMYLSSAGRLGLGTSSPSVELHIVDGDSPTLRINQDASSGWTAQSWDLAGNETNFFIRDVTNGSKLPFRIEPGSSDNMVAIKGSNVGNGTWTPSVAYHVKRTDGTANITVEEASGTTANRNLLTLTNNGQATFSIDNTGDTVGEWRLSAADDDSFFIQNPDIGGTNKEFEIKSNGDIYVAGAVVHSSDRNLKEGIIETDGVATLNKLVSLPIATWNYKSDPQATTHMGPMAQDFYAAFSLGADDKHIATLDFSGVAFSAIQGLYEVVESKDAQLREMVQSKDAQIQELQARLKKLEVQQHARLDGIEQAVSLLISNQAIVTKTSTTIERSVGNSL